MHLLKPNIHSLSHILKILPTEKEWYKNGIAMLDSRKYYLNTFESLFLALAIGCIACI